MKTRLALIALVVALATAVPEGQLLNCTISTSGVAFGNYDVFSASPVNSTGTVTYQCTLAVNIRVELGRGLTAPTFSPRIMTSGSNTLNYNLYLDSARTQIWGNGTGGTVAYTALASILLPTNVTVYGQVPALQDAHHGSYNDTVVATIIF